MRTQLGKVFHNRSLDGPRARSGRRLRRLQGEHGRRGADAVHALRRTRRTRPLAKQSWRARAATPASCSPAMRRELMALEPNAVLLDNQTMDSQVDMTLMPAQAGAVSVSGVGVVAMVLAAVGLRRDRVSVARRHSRDRHPDGARREAQHGGGAGDEAGTESDRGRRRGRRVFVRRVRQRRYLARSTGSALPIRLRGLAQRLRCLP